MRAILMTCLLAAAPAAQTQDIRGQTFDLDVGLRVEGSIAGQPLQLFAEEIAVAATPWTFDVLPDPAAPFDATRLLIRMRLPDAPDALDPVRFELLGTYDARSGALDAAGMAVGCHLWKSPFESDAFAQIDALAHVAIMLRDPTIELHAMVVASVSDSQIMGVTLAGGAALDPRTVAATIVPNASLVGWLPGGADDFSTAVIGPYLLDDASIELTSLQAFTMDVFGDLNGDLHLTQADVIAMHGMAGPVTAATLKADVTADGTVDGEDVAYETWLVRCIGTPVIGGPVIMEGTAVKATGGKLVGLP